MRTRGRGVLFQKVPRAASDRAQRQAMPVGCVYLRWIMALLSPTQNYTTYYQFFERKSNEGKEWGRETIPRTSVRACYTTFAKFLRPRRPGVFDELKSCSECSKLHAYTPHTHTHTHTQFLVLMMVQYGRTGSNCVKEERKNGKDQAKGRTCV